MIETGDQIPTTTLRRNARPIDDLKGRITGVVTTAGRPKAFARFLASWPAELGLVVVDNSQDHYASNLVDPTYNAEVVAVPYGIGMSGAYDVGLQEVQTSFWVFLEDDFTLYADTLLSTMAALVDGGPFGLVAGCVYRKVRKAGKVALQNNAGQFGRDNTTLYVNRIVPEGPPIDAVVAVEKVPNFFLADTAAIRDAGGFDACMGPYLHLDFYLSLLYANVLVGWTAVPGAAVYHDKCAVADEMAAAKYQAIRRKPLDQGRLAFLDKHGLDRVVGSDSCSREDLCRQS